MFWICIISIVFLPNPGFGSLLIMLNILISHQGYTAQLLWAFDLILLNYTDKLHKNWKKELKTVQEFPQILCRTFHVICSNICKPKNFLAILLPYVSIWHAQVCVSTILPRTLGTNLMWKVAKSKTLSGMAGCDTKSIPDGKKLKNSHYERWRKQHEVPDKFYRPQHISCIPKCDLFMSVSGVRKMLLV